MRRTFNNRILARTEPAGFVGRTAELDRLLNHAAGEGGSHGLVVLAVPSVGTSELLRQAYDRLFTEQEDVIPFYFEIRASDRSAQNAARRFLSEFLLQIVAFRRRDPKLIDVSPEIGEIAELAMPSDGRWIDRLVETYVDGRIGDERSFARNCLSSPMRAAVNGARSFVMIDNLHVAAGLDGGEAFIEDITDVFSRFSLPFVFTGHRRFLFAKTPFETMAVEKLPFADAGKFIERLSAKTGTAVNDQTRDLIAVQLGGNVTFIGSLFASAVADENDLNSFQRVEQTYTDEIFGGRIGKYFDAIFDRILPDRGTQTNVLRLLSEQMAAVDEKVPVAYWKKHLGLSGTEFDAAMDALNCSEIINASSGSVGFDSSNIALCDYIRGRARLEIGGEPRALAVGEALSENVRRASELMARSYRRIAAIGLRELLLAFDGRQVSPTLIDYGRFKEEFKGADDDKVLKALKEDNEKVALPQIVYTAHTGDFYSKLNELCDIERSAVALGFANAGKKEETAWIAAEIDSKLEASRELVEFWCDRLEMAALNCNFSRFKLWLITSEGFEPDAMDVLRNRNAYGSSRKQVEILTDILGTEIGPFNEKAFDEYEFVVPMGENTEMIAAHTVEEIAKRHAFPSKAINQIKTALVEACINAAEHSLSPDRKTRLKFAVDDDKITITVSNRGLRLADKTHNENVPEEGRRGWGLKLIRGLMDEVNIEQVDDGTRITMVKYLKNIQ